MRISTNNSRRYLITGGAGFIGANLVRHLAGPDSDIRVLDNLSSGQKWDLSDLDLEFIEGDIRDKSVVDVAVAGVSKVVHLAAHTSVVESVANPEADFEINVRGTLNLLQASVRHGVERFVFASTGGAIVGEATPPVHENMPPNPISPYGASKLASEGYCSAYFGSYGLKTVSLRFSNVYGPYSYHKGSVIAKFFRQIQRGDPLTVYGDGEQTRDFVFVGDLCRGIASAMEVAVPYGKAIQLGSGQEISINGLIAMLRPIVGERNFPSVTFAPARSGEVLRNYVSIDRAREHLGFQPSTDLPAGLRETWEWFQRI